MADNTQLHNAVVAAVKDYIGYQGGYIQKNWGGPLGERGRPDLEGCIRGRFFAVEVKTGTGHLSKDQKHHQQRIQQAQGIFIEAHSVDDVEDALLAEGLVVKSLLR